jgi:hypothetical protein
MIGRLSERGRLAFTVAVGALTVGLGGAGVIGLATVGSSTSHAAVSTPPGSPVYVGPGDGGFDPCFVAIAYGNNWGFCVQPPTT